VSNGLSCGTAAIFYSKLKLVIGKEARGDMGYWY